MNTNKTNNQYELEEDKASSHPCIHCGHTVLRHAVDDEERRECLDCECEQFEFFCSGGYL